MSARILVVHHAPTRGTQTLLERVLAGANDPEIEGVDVRDKPALEVAAEDLLAADGYVLLTPANFGYMSGAMKHMFDSTFLQIGGALDDGGSGNAPSGSTNESTKGRPYAVVVHGRYDTAGAVRSIESIVGALGWDKVCEVAEVMGEVTEEHGQAAYELGATVAAHLMR